MDGHHDLEAEESSNPGKSGRPQSVAMNDIAVLGKGVEGTGEAVIRGIQMPGSCAWGVLQVYPVMFRGALRCRPRTDVDRYSVATLSQSPCQLVHMHFNAAEASGSAFLANESHIHGIPFTGGAVRGMAIDPSN
jgi:hypothetical protein